MSEVISVVTCSNYQNQAVELKEKGNEAVKNKNWSEAIDLFSQAIKLDPNNEAGVVFRPLTYRCSTVTGLLLMWDSSNSKMP